MKPTLTKFPPYSLPRLYGWHLIPRQDIKDSGKRFKYFGANWWDLLFNDELPVSKGKISIKTKDVYAVIFINMGKTSVMMTNITTGDVYNIMPGKRSMVNNTFNKEVVMESSDPENIIHLTKIGSIWIVMLNIQQLRSGESQVKYTDVFNDYLLMTGVPDKDQYLNTVGIEMFDYVEVEGWKYKGTESGNKIDFTEMLLDHWKKVNPQKPGSKPVNGIPKVVQWIWLRRDPRKQEFGPLKPLFYKFMNTWVKRNPNFIFNVWTDNPDFKVPKMFEGIITVKGPEEIEKLLNRLDSNVKAKIKFLFKNHLNPGARSDTLRQVILYLEGGWYGDVNDSVCLAPLDKMSENFDYLIGMEPVVYVNNAIVASKKRHVFSQCMISWLAYHAKEFVEEWEDDYVDEEQDAKDDYIVSTTGPIALTQVIFGAMMKHENKLKNTLILPSAWVYPNYWISETSDKWLKPVSIFAHYDQREFLASK